MKLSPGGSGGDLPRRERDQGHRPVLALLTALCWLASALPREVLLLS